jgi:hypothetical protein|tara:strand:- start:1217 stop:1867 length:651 start_codon:yes stop_codon:yes gene_type:complete
MKFKFINLGQTVTKYETPLNIYNAINDIYENKFSMLNKANKQLIGKIVNEHSIFYGGDDESKMKKHDLLPLEVKQWFIDMFKHYLNFNHIKKYDLRLNSIWVNEMKANEYNPIHVHQGTLFTGLSSVMVLKLPSTFGVEYSSKENPQNGKLQILGSCSGQFAKTDYQPKVSVRDFYIFPYDMRHCVYPFNGTKETRRTLAANCDVDYSPIMNRGAT